MTDILLLLSGMLTGTVRVLVGLLLITCLLPQRKRPGWLRMALFVGIFYGIGVFFWQFLLSAWMGVLFRSPDFLDPETPGGQAALWLLNLLLGTAVLYGFQNRERLEKSAFRFQAQVEFPRRTNIRSVDLCAILGNLLDNAIEASRQVPEQSGRTVVLTIRRIHQMLVIKVENSFTSAPVQENGQMKTTKTGGGLHQRHSRQPGT